MAVVKTRLFAATHQRPTTPPDGKSLEEQMNAFLSTLTLASVMDVQTDVIETRRAVLMYVGTIVFQA